LRNLLLTGHQLLLQLSLDQKLTLLGGQDRKFIAGIPSLHIPPARMSDGPLGVSVTVIGTRALLPSNNYAAGIALAASWDPQLARRIGEALGDDARTRDVQVLLGPAVNLIRAPQDGRAFEYFGEDPYLAAQLAVPYIEGVQSKGVIATVKHFAANNSEFDRNHTNSIVDEQTLHELYLPAFKAAIQQANVGAVMDSYNLLNGTHLTQDCALNVDLLRHDWGFQGIVMSDWDATYNGLAAARCGLDLEMPYAKFMTPATLRGALDSHQLDIATIDEKVLHILRTEIRFGLLEPSPPTLPALYTPAARRLALDSALESIVLLQNQDHLLPLARSNIHTLAVIGTDAYPAVPGGGGSSRVSAFAPVSILNGIVDEAGTGTRILYSRGLPSPEEIFADTNFDQPLTLEEFDNAAYSGNPIHTEQAAHIANWHSDVWTPAQKPRYLRWSGAFIPTKTGSYLLLAGAFNRDTYDIAVDGHNVIDQPPAEGQAPRTAKLTLNGGHAIRIVVRYTATNPTSRMGFGIRFTGDLILPEAIAAAKAADAVVLSAGFDPTSESEGYDRSFQLPWGQDDLIQTIAALNPHTIVTLTAGGDVDMSTWLTSVPALLHTWYPGQEGGHALAQILFGDASPSGHLPVSFERAWADTPTHDFYYPTKGSNDVRYGEGLFLGYRYYTSPHTGSQTKPLFPFGFGLTYTAFQFSHLTASAATNAGLRVTFDVQNTGQRAAIELCQLYAGLEQPGVARPTKELKAFQRLTLQPGQTERVTFLLSPAQLSFYSTQKHAWQPAPGQAHLYVGDSSEDTPLQTSVRLP
jgi:beta-glucosidase